MSSVHLDVMELEGDRKRRLEASFTILAPHYHWIAKLICVLVHYAVQFCMYHCGRTYYHGILYERAFTLFRSLSCQSII